MSPVRKPDKTEVVKIRITIATKEIIMKEAEKNYRTFAEECRMRLDESVRTAVIPYRVHNNTKRSNTVP